MIVPQQSQHISDEMCEDIQLLAMKTAGVMCHNNVNIEKLLIKKKSAIFYSFEISCE